MKNKKVIYAVLGVIAVLIVLIMIDSLNSNMNGSKKKIAKENQYIGTNNIIRSYGTATLVRDYKTFYTIEECLNKYMVFLTTGGFDSAYKLLNPNYRQEVYSEYKSFSDTMKEYEGRFLSIKLKEVYKVDNTYFCYALGIEQLHDEEAVEDISFIVHLYEDKKLFDIVPDGYMYKVNEKKSYNKDQINIVVNSQKIYFDKIELDITIMNNTSNRVSFNELYVKQDMNREKGMLMDNRYNSIELNAREGGNFILIFSNNIDIVKTLTLNSSINTEPINIDLL